MKKFYYYLLLALPMIMFASCDDDKNLPNVDVSITVDGGVSVDNVIYVVKGDTLKIESINVSNREEGKTAVITSASYYWDGLPAGISVTPPFGANFVTKNMSLGKHLLQIQSPVYAVDKSVGMLYMGYNVELVEDAADIPDGNQETVLAVVPDIKES